MGRKRVMVAMSGGVDSSVAAALLKEAGYEVDGVYLRLWPDHSREETVRNLERTCQLLDIPLHKLDLEADFQQLVIDYFCQEYHLGHTPNPCIACNQHIKFGLLLKWVLGTGADYLATGHYAQVKRSPGGYQLLKAIDPNKDQSYFLYTLGQGQLKHLLLPLGNLRKAEVRRLAERLGLPASSTHDSQDVCFIPDNDYRSFIARHISLAAGDIVNAEGKILGRHGGLARYTVGQRQGLRLNKRLYVIRLDASSNRLVVGTRDQLLSSSLSAGRLSWVSGKAPESPGNITARVRYRSPRVATGLYPRDSRVEVQLSTPQLAIAPGQAIVFYEGDAVLGGGVIEDRVN